MTPTTTTTGTGWPWQSSRHGSAESEGGTVPDRGCARSPGRGAGGGGRNRRVQDGGVIHGHSNRLPGERRPADRARTYRASVLYTTFILWRVPHVCGKRSAVPDPPPSSWVEPSHLREVFPRGAPALARRAGRTCWMTAIFERSPWPGFCRRSPASGTRTSGWSRRADASGRGPGNEPGIPSCWQRGGSLTRVVHRSLRARPRWPRGRTVCLASSAAIAASAASTWGRSGRGRASRTARSVDEVLQPVAQLDEGEVDALRVELACRAARASSAAVTSMSVIASHCSTTQRGLPLAHEAADLLAEHARRWRRTAAPPSGRRRRPGARSASGSASTLCQPSDAVDPAEHRAVRPPAAPEEQQDRQRDGDHDALQHAEEDDAGGRHQRQRQRAAAHAPVAGAAPRRPSARAPRRSPPRRAPSAAGRRAAS